MSSLHNRIFNVASTRLSTIRRNASNLTAQLAELHELRDLVARHSGFDWSIPSQLRTGMSCGATRISMLRGTPG